MITAGCEIQSWTVDAVCATERELRENKGAVCKSAESCPCLRLTTPAPSRTLKSGGRIAATSVAEPAYAEVFDNSANIYDHIRVTLNWDRNKFKSCMPTGYESGIFYYPMADTTSLISVGCSINPTAGTVSCVNGLAKELGFGNLQISNIISDDTAYLDETYNAQAVITKSGPEKMCLQYFVYKGTPEQGILKIGPKNLEVVQTYSSQELLIPIGQMTADFLGAGTPYTKSVLNNNDVTTPFTVVDSVDTGSQSGGTLAITFLDDGDKNINCVDGKDKVKFGTNTEFVQFTCTNNKFTDGLRTVAIQSIKMPDTFKQSEFTLSYNFGSAATDTRNEQQMTIVVKAGLPNKLTQSCDVPQLIPETSAGAKAIKQFMLYRNKPSTPCPETEIGDETNKKLITQDCACSNIACKKGQSCYRQTAGAAPICVGAATTPFGSCVQNGMSCETQIDAINKCDTSTITPLGSNGCAADKVCCSIVPSCNNAITWGGCYNTCQTGTIEITGINPTLAGHVGCSSGKTCCTKLTTGTQPVSPVAQLNGKCGASSTPDIGTCKTECASGEYDISSSIDSKGKKCVSGYCCYKLLFRIQS
ncbi:MAG: hypothetical protein HZB62_04955 [Nitrospirae bacterium]|nr:hypothetical protein [Nitrospirota bacterium]